MSKKAFSIVKKIIIGLALMLSPFLYFNTVLSFISSSGILVNNNSGSSIYLTPGDDLSILFSGSNSYGENLNNVGVEISFGNNSGFSYSGNDLFLLIENFNAISKGEYSTSNGINYSTSDTLINGGPIGMNSAGPSFSIDADISTYRNDLSLKFYGNADSNGSLIYSNNFLKTIFVDVKPHIINKYLEKNGTKVTSIKGNGQEEIDLIVEIEDLNSCNNVNGGNVTADLTSLGLTNNESLTFDSCISSNVARFKKTGISSYQELGNQNIQYTAFSVTDEDGNSNAPEDANFVRGAEKNNLTYSVVAPGSPNIYGITTPEGTITSKVNSKNIDINFNVDQNSSVKIALENCTQKDTNKIFYQNANFIADSGGTATIEGNKLNSGNNNIYICADNGLGEVGNSTLTISEDSIAPIVNIISNSTSVIEEDADIDFSCSEDGNYYVDITNTSGTTRAIEKTAVTASTVTNVILSNSNLVIGGNDIFVFCEDSIGNNSSVRRNIVKIEPTPSMETANLTAVDNDIDYEGLSGRDFSVSWDTTIGENFDGFFSYNIYILPKGAILGAGVQSYVGSSEDASIGSLELNPSLVEDSLGDPLISGVDYTVYILIVGTSGQLGTPGTFEITPVSDNIIKPVPISAKFTSNTTLEITTDTTLNTDLSSFDASKVVYKVNGAFYSPTSVISVDGAKINYTIPSLEDPSATGTELDIGAFGLRSSVGGFNDDFTGKLNITDGQKPTFLNFNTGDSAIYDIYFSENMSLSWSHNENIKSGTMKIIFKSIFGAPSSDKITNLTGNYLTAGSHNITLNLNDINDPLSPKLICGANYNIILEGEDLAGNKAVSTSIDNVNMDNCVPEKTTINNLDIEGVSDINFTWQATNDDSIFSSGVGKYTLELFSGNSCVTALETINDIATNSLDKNLADGDYSWKVKALDNIGNSGEYSDCDDFKLDSTIPSFSNVSLNDTTDSSDSYINNGNTLELKANITNTDINNIYADINELIGDASYNNVSCLAPLAGVTCTLVGDLVTYSFNAGGINALNAGLKNSKLTAYNISGINKVEETKEITADVSAPSVLSDALIYPNGGEVIGGDDLRILWDKTKVTDDIGIEKVEITIIDGGVEGFVICSGENTGFCDLNLYEPLIEDIKVRLTAIDKAGKESFDESDSVFTIDRKAPEVGADTVLFPNGGEIFGGGEEITITWDPSKVTDDTSLDPNPVIIYISEDDTGYYRILEENLPNTGSHTFNLPDTFAPEATIRVGFKDIVGNIGSDDSDNIFKIDNRTPTLEITYAGTGGTTPHSGRSLNGTGMDLSLLSSDDNLDRVYVEFKNITNNTFWDNTNLVYSAGLVENNICVDGLPLGNDGSCNNVSLSFNPDIDDLSNYEMIVYVVDEAGNIKTSAINSYIGDKQNPTLIINPLPEFFSNNTEISGTSSDLSGISAVNIKIKKGEEYWNGSEFTSSEISLVAKTSDNYANWRYDINPLEEEDGTLYSFEVTALDKAYKDNNTTSSSVSIKSDNRGPIINEGFSILPSEGTVLSGGETINITWDNSKIIDAFSGVDNNTLEMSYFNGSSYENIASNIDLNLGTFSWSVPYVDTEISRIKFRIRDNLGNYSFNFDGNDFSIDSTNPSVSSLETLENGISNGNINALRFKLSESILDSSINISDFSVDSGAISITGFSTGALANDDEIIIEFSEVSGTGTTPTLSYSGTSVEDLAGRKLGSFSNIDSIDKATPRVLSREAFDSDENGKIDKIEITFSENLSSLSSLQGIYVSGLLSGYNDTGANSVSNKIIIDISEGFENKTDTNGLLISISGGNYSDTSGNNIESFGLENVSDKVKPIFISARTVDGDSNNKVDEIRLEFSENMSNAILNDFALSNYSTGMTFDSVSIENSEVVLNLGETSLDNDTDNAILVSYTPGTLGDLNGNITNQITNELTLDTLPPIIEKIETRDLNKNGLIDAIYIEVNENLNDDFSLVNFGINGYNISSLDSGNTDNDNNFIINIDELSFKDTGATPLVRLSSNSSLGDEHGNDIVSFIDGQNALDKVGPIIKSARYEENGPGVSDDKLYITFSEDISAGSIDTNVGGFVNDFSISNFGVIGNTAITTITSPTTIEVVLGANSSPLSPGVTGIYAKVGGIIDSNGNQSNSDFNLTNIIVSSSVIINEVMFANDRNNQYIELRNLSNSTANLSGITIKNVGGNGVDYTFSSGTVPSNGYYLVAGNTKENSIINVDPDLVLPSLNLNSVSQNNIELEQGGTIIDSAKASPYPAGNSLLGYSMERKEAITEGSLDSSWYTAQASSNLDSNSYKGTPKLANIFDGVSPVISSYSPNDDDLLHIAPKIVFNYIDDNIGIDTTSATFAIKKWNSGNFSSDLSGTLLESSIIENNKSTYQIRNSALAGRYRAEFQISDLAGNTVSQNIEFFIDRFTSSITNSSINIGDIMPGAGETSLQEVTLTINTIGSGFKITQDKITQLSSGISAIGSYNGDTGFGYQIEKNRKGTIIPYSLVNNISGEIENIEKLSTPNSQIETYIYKIRYYVKPELIQSAGVYSSDINIKVLPVY